MANDDNLRTTDLHEWEYPLTGYDSARMDRPYGDLFTKLIEDYLDESIPVVDADANKSQYPPKPGAIFLADDTGYRYRGDGADWLPWPFPGGSGDADTISSDTYEAGGTDPLNVTGLQGDLADPQDPKLHAITHEDAGTDEINVTGLQGDLADPQDPKPHSAMHENGGTDEINLTGLSGLLADPQTPTTHDNSAHTSNYALESHTHTSADLPADVTFNSVTTTSLNGALTGNISVSSLAGDGLEILNGALSLNQGLEFHLGPTAPTNPDETTVWLDDSGL